MAGTERDEGVQVRGRPRHDGPSGAKDSTRRLGAFAALALPLAALITVAGVEMLQRSEPDNAVAGQSLADVPEPSGAVPGADLPQAPAEEGADVDGAPADDAGDAAGPRTHLSRLLAERVASVLPSGFRAVDDEEVAAASLEDAKALAATFEHRDRGIRLNVIRSRMDSAAITNLMAASLGTDETWPGTTFANVHESRRGGFQFIVVDEGGVMTNVRLHANGPDQEHDMTVDEARLLVQAIVGSPFD